MKVPVAPAVFGYREAPSLPDLVEIINFARFFSVVIREVRAAFRYNLPPHPGSPGDESSGQVGLAEQRLRHDVRIKAMFAETWSTCCISNRPASERSINA